MVAYTLPQVRVVVVLDLLGSAMIGGQRCSCAALARNENDGGEYAALSLERSCTTARSVGARHERVAGARVVERLRELETLRRGCR
jgi:hypothetical protein